MNDIYVVISEAWDGRRNERCVLAGDELDARQAHQEHHPYDHIVTVKAHG